jgi:hypothetical protein
VVEEGPCKYSFDANVLIDLCARYPSDLFPDIWSKLDDMARAGRIVLAREVRREITTKADSAAAWVRKNDEFIGDSDDSATFSQAQATPQLSAVIETDGTHPAGDAFVISLAIRIGAVVVTDETREKGSRKIPKLCDRLGVRCIDTVGLFRREKWKFRLAD